MLAQINQFINGQQVIGEGDVHPVFNPALGDVVSEVMFSSSKQVEQAIIGAKDAFIEWSQVTPMRRARVLFKFKDLLEQHIDELAAMVTKEHGKILDDARGEILRAIELVEFHCAIPSHLRGTYSENVGSQMDSYTIRQSLGVCAGVSPFNFPVMISTWQFIPAIACGNTFILKPSEKDPSVTIRLAELLTEAGLPNGVLNVVHGDKCVVDQLLHHPDIQTITAVGSTPVAKYIYETGITQGKRAHCFGGAKNHAVILPDADIDQTADAILGAAYGAAGERCMAIPVAVCVGDKTADALVSQLKKRVPELRVGPGDEEGIEMGPLVTAEHLAHVKSYIEIGVNEGAELVVDGRDLKISGHEKGFFMGGCLFDHVQPDMRIYQEEIFGPVLCILRIKDFDSAVELVNKHIYGNGTAIFTHDGDAARTFVNRIQAGMVGVNVPIPVPVAYHPFGGWKQSVFGDIGMHGGQSVQFYTKLKSVTTRWPKAVRTGAEFKMPNLK